MTSKYEKTQGTVFSVSAEVATEANPLDAVWLSASCSTKELNFTGGQKDDIDVTSLCSTEKEMVNGLSSPAEMTVNRNWSAEETAQSSLMAAYEDDTRRAITVVFPSGNGFAYLAEVRQNSWSAGLSGVVSASYTLRIIGKPVKITPVVPESRAALAKKITV